MRRYRLDAAVGRGGASVVYRATDQILNMTVAVKVLLQVGEALAMGLRNEAAAAMRLHHLNIVRVFNYEEDPSWTFLVMEYLEGTDCQQARRAYADRRLPVPEVQRVVSATCDALAYAHSMGVAHHDVKPSNIILVGPDLVKVCDFGIASAIHGRGRSKPSISLGTPAFMAPERIRGEHGDARSDIYSLGATLYTLITGSTPFGNDVPAVYHRHLNEPVPRAPELSPALYDLLCRAMAKDARDRQPTIEAFQKELGRAWEPHRPSSTVIDDDPVPEIEVEFTEQAAVVLTEPLAARTPTHEPEVAPDGMVEIPDFEFSSIHSRVHVAVEGFFIDRFQVTNAEFAEFIIASDEMPPDDWPGRTPPAHLREHPVTSVSHAQARRYAHWKGKRLPTSLEWEAAVCAPDGRTFPWGDEFFDEAVNGPHLGHVQTVPVGASEFNVSAFGVYDLIGNTWEWTDVDDRDEQPDDDATWVFGGSFRHDCSPAGHAARNAVRVSNAYAYLGFRCARSRG